ncbi:MAG: APC family permease [Acidobacteria bacterium]|nr:APC family permease [Acidobacteriota bacterium]
MLRRFKELLIGSPLETAALPEQRLGKLGALPILASDNLSSAAYATEEMVLAIAAGAATGLLLPPFYSIPLAVGIGLLTLIVAISYGQTLHAYPTGGGAYTVAKENLGVAPALVAGSALLIDYVLTVAVSVAAGIAAITSAVPALLEHRVGLSVLGVVVILLANLRGVRENAAVFAPPVYFFVISIYMLIGGALVQYFIGDVAAAPPAASAPQMTWNFAFVFLVLRSFASGCAALTGIEAVANGVRIFRPPAPRNAAITLYVMAAFLGTMFVGITVVCYLYGIQPVADGSETMLSQLGRTVFGTGPVYYAIQAATMAILILAANTSFADFPRLASVMAADRFLPRQLANLGDRLVFSNGIVVLAAAASLLIALYDAQTHRLLPLYLVGVFTAITLSQAGMVIHWKRSQEPGKGHRMAVNAVGAVLTGLVLLVIATVKFVHGAWIVVVAIPLLALACRRVREHYYQVGRELSLMDYEKPEELRHTAVIPVPASPNKMVLAAIEYARSISKDVIAVHINRDGEDREQLQRQWHAWTPDVPLVVLDSPYRAITQPLMRFIDEIHNWRDEDVVTVVIPEFVTSRWWHHFLHNQTTAFLKVALLFKPHVVVTSVPHHLRR